MKLRYSLEAIDDLARLRDFIAKHNPSAARRTAQSLRKGIRELQAHPRRGRRVLQDDGQAAPEAIRELVIGSYVVRYLLLTEEIIVLRLWHGREQR